MKKNSILGYASLGILFLLVSVIAFVVPTEKTAAFWAAYGFTVVAFLMQIGTWKIALGRENTLKSKFLGFPVVYISTVYLVLQILILAVFTAVEALPVWASVAACSLVLAVCAVCMISSEAGRGEIERVEAAVQKQVFYIRNLQVDVELLVKEEPDPEIKKELQQLAEKIRFSDPMSHESLADIELCISNKIENLKTEENKMEIIREIILLLAERNKKCKLLK